MRAFVYIGAPGAGKSTHAANLAKTENAVVISADNLRLEHGEDADLWGCVGDSVAEVAGSNVVLDGTHCLRTDRQAALALLKSFGYEIVEAVVVNPSLETCLKRNSSRSEQVPEYGIREIHESLQHSLKTIITEPWTHIHFVC